MATRFKQNRVKENPAAVSRWRLMKFLTVCIVVAIVFSSPQIKCARKRMVRLCIASVDPAKLSSQCVMCDRYEFALAVIECAGMTQVKELISNPLSVQEATCLIMHCRQVSNYSTSLGAARDYILIDTDWCCLVMLARKSICSKYQVSNPSPTMGP